MNRWNPGHSISLHSSVDRAVGFYPIGRGFESFWGHFTVTTAVPATSLRLQVASDHINYFVDRILMLNGIAN